MYTTNDYDKYTMLKTSSFSSNTISEKFFLLTEVLALVKGEKNVTKF